MILNSCRLSLLSYEDGFIRHIRFENPMRIEIDGKKNIGVVYKPSCNNYSENKP